MTAHVSSVPRKPRVSMRTQLVVGTIVGLTLILAFFGLFVRYVVSGTLIGAVDRDLQERVAQLIHRPPPRPQGPDSDTPGSDRPGQGPPLDQQQGPEQPPNQPPGNDGGPPPPDSGQGPDNEQSPGMPFNGPPGEGPDRGPGLPGGIYRPRRFRIDGSTLDRFDRSPAWDVAAINKANATVGPVFTVITDGGVDLRVLTVKVAHPGRPVWFAQAPYPLTEVNAAIEGVDRALLTLIPIALLIAGIGGMLVTENVLSRVRQLVHSAARIGADNLSERLPVLGRDEFAELAETFNALLERVDTAFQEQARVVEQQRRFTADASHELKTPLTVIRGTTSLALTGSGILDRQSTEEVDDAAATMSDLVQDLIYLARSDAGQIGRERIEIALSEPLQTAIGRISSMSQAPIILAAANDYVVVRASENELVRLFSNILVNAAHHTPATGRIAVTLTKTSTEAVVTIRDTGAGIAPEHLEHLCERFYRVDEARTRDAGGSGLGLAICKGIVEAHAGSLRIESTVGRGTTVTVTLPRVS